MLALHGFDVVGLEISQTGVSVAEKYAFQELQAPKAYNFGDDGPCTQQRGSVSIIQGDFFHPDSTNGERFDIIYDYTVCFSKIYAGIL